MHYSFYIVWKSTDLFNNFILLEETALFDTLRVYTVVTTLKLKCDFQRGWWFQSKKPPVGGVWIIFQQLLQVVGYYWLSVCCAQVHLSQSYYSILMKFS